MVQVKNEHWTEVEHSPFDSRYAAHLVVSDISGEDLGVEEQRVIAITMTASADTHIAVAKVDYHPENGYTEVTSTVEGEDAAAALSVFSRDLIEAIMVAGRDPENIELVAAHIVYEQKLIDDQKGFPVGTVVISDMAYMVDVIPLFTANQIGEQDSTDAARVFYTARDEAIGLL